MILFFFLIDYSTPLIVIFFFFFPQAYLMRNAGAVIHSHGMESCLVTMLNPLAKEFRVNMLQIFVKLATS